MNLYKISQDENNSYDTFDSAIVAAESEDAARNIHPQSTWGTLYEGLSWNKMDAWASKPEKVLVELIGVAKDGTEAGAILASFNAG